MKRRKAKQKGAERPQGSQKADLLRSARPRVSLAPSGRDAFLVGVLRSLYPKRIHGTPGQLTDAGYPAAPPTPDDIYTAARIVEPGDSQMPEVLRAMADELKAAMEDIGYEPQGGKSYHVVTWREAGLAITVYGDPSDGDSWKESLNKAFWEAWDNALAPFVEREHDHEVH